MRDRTMVVRPQLLLFFMLRMGTIPLLLPVLHHAVAAAVDVGRACCSSKRLRQTPDMYLLGVIEMRLSRSFQRRIEGASHIGIKTRRVSVYERHRRLRAALRRGGRLSLRRGVSAFQSGLRCGV
ncbi:hypothetical protein NDU88_001431 [Pleurodeles waltl]|uniref:Secreted protein n=1 Tax=Pleurodeles waltl TaxID=8319 RepID=A0AAV7VZ68_PLEWA|nr:hypothetical protein NDU88_001431 [Pleurodeles waltl]